MRFSLAIYFDDPNRLGYPFSDPAYFESYRDFTALCKDHDIDLYIVRGDSYQGNMQFASGWQFAEGKLTDIDHPITVDLIIIKGLKFTLELGPDDLVLNNPEFDRLCGDKWLTYQAVGTFMTPTYQINQENWQEVLAKIGTDKVVLKPEIGTSGSGIFIEPTATCNFPALQTSEPYIAQEFLDSSAGIPGLIDGLHDLRIVFFNNKPTLSYIRTPQPGKLISNVAAGGSVTVLEIEKVPTDFLRVAQEVDAGFGKYNPRMYTVDFLFANGKPYIVELNPRPGFPHASHEGQAFADLFYKTLIELVISSISAHRALQK